MFSKSREMVQQFDTCLSFHPPPNEGIERILEEKLLNFHKSVHNDVNLVFLCCIKQRALFLHFSSQKRMKQELRRGIQERALVHGDAQ